MYTQYSYVLCAHNYKGIIIYSIILTTNPIWYSLSTNTIKLKTTCLFYTLHDMYHIVLDQIMLSNSGISTEMFVLLANCFLHWWKSIIPK